MEIYLDTCKKEVLFWFCMTMTCKFHGQKMSSNKRDKPEKKTVPCIHISSKVEFFSRSPVFQKLQFSWPKNVFACGFKGWKSTEKAVLVKKKNIPAYMRTISETISVQLRNTAAQFWSSLLHKIKITSCHGHRFTFHSLFLQNHAAHFLKSQLYLDAFCLVVMEPPLPAK